MHAIKSPPTIRQPVLGENEFAELPQKNGLANGHHGGDSISNGFIKAATKGGVLSNGGSNGLRSRKLQ